MGVEVPERLINYTVYLEGNISTGTADVKLPSIEALTDSVGGAGIAGELDTPVLGHFKSMVTSIKWRTITKNTFKLFKQAAHQVDFRGSQQVYDSGAGKYKTVPVRVSMKLMPKKVDLGAFQMAKATDTENEFEVMYIKTFVDGDEVLEIDKLNFICKIDGEDILASVRDDLGL